MTNAQLAEELRDWARARTACNKRRADKGKEPLDSRLLLDTADRLEKMESCICKDGFGMNLSCPVHAGSAGRHDDFQRGRLSVFNELREYIKKLSAD